MATRTLTSRAPLYLAFLVVPLFLSLLAAGPALAEGLGIPTSRGVLGFGNLEEFTGIRVNLMDDKVERVTGLNVTFWKPGRNNHGLYRGIQVSLVGQGAMLTQGFSISGLGLGSGDLQGIGIGGLGVGGDNIQGIAVGGLGVGGDNIQGIAVGGLGVGGDNIQGIAVGSLGVGGDNIRGIAVGGLGVGGDNIQGIAVGGLGVGGDRLKGLFAGVGVGGDRIEGAAISAAYLKADFLEGVGTGAYTHLQEAHGLCLGILNRARILRGVQIGLLNYAGNNPRGLQWVPGINVHF